jgi:hypothetical protein
LAGRRVITKAQNLPLFLKCNLNKDIFNRFEWHIAGIGDDFKSLKDFVTKNVLFKINLNKK